MPETLNPETNLEEEVNLGNLGNLPDNFYTPTPKEGGGVTYDSQSARQGLVDLSHYTDDISKYTEYGVPLGRRFDWNEVRAQNQSTGEKWSRGLKKAGITTFGAIAENTLGVVAGLGSLLSGNDYFDNSVGRGIDDMNEWAREEMPNYYTQEEQDKSAFARLGTANFWADKALNGIAYSLGSIATMALTGGVGVIGMASKVGSTALKLGSTAKKAERIHKLYKIAKEAKKAGKLSGMYQKLNAAHKLRRGVQAVDAGLMMSLAEGSVEARETKNHMRETLLQDALEREGVRYKSQLSDQAKQDIENYASAAGNMNFGMNMAVLTASNILMFGKMLGPRVADAGEGAVKGLVKRGGKVVDTQASGLGKFRRYAAPFVKSGATEGTQEGLQYASNITSSDYYRARFKDNGTADMMGAAMGGLKRTFGDTEGIESIMLGVITGGIMSGGSLRKHGARNEKVAKVLKILNDDKFVKSIDRANANDRTLSFLEQMDAYNAEGDTEMAENSRISALMSEISEVSDAGQINLYMEKLDDAAELSDEEFKEQFGYDSEATVDKYEIIEKMKSDVENIVERKAVLDAMFPSTIRGGVSKWMMSEEEAKEEQSSHIENLILKDTLLHNAVFLDKVSQKKKDLAYAIAPLLPGVGQEQLEKAADSAKEVYDSKIKSMLEESDTATNEMQLTQEQRNEATITAIQSMRINLRQYTDENDKLHPMDLEKALNLLTTYYGHHAHQQNLFETWDQLQSKQGRENYLRAELESQPAMIREIADKKVDELIQSTIDPEELAAKTPKSASRAKKNEVKFRNKEIKELQEDTLAKFKGQPLSTIQEAINERLKHEENLPASSIEQANALVELSILRQLAVQKKSEVKLATKEVEKAAIPKGRNQLERIHKALKSAKGFKDQLQQVAHFINNVHNGAIPTAEEQALVDKVVKDLKEQGYEIHDSFLPGKTHHPGNIVEIIGVIEDSSLEPGEAIYGNITSPAITKDGQQIQRAEISLKQNSTEKPSTKEAEPGAEANDPLYSAMIVEDQEKLKRVYKPKHPNVIYHHSTIEFGVDQEGVDALNIGDKHRLKIIGRVTTEEVDVILMEYPEGVTQSDSENPHITLSVAEGIKPFESNAAIAKAIQEGNVIVYKSNRYVDVIEGYVTKGQEDVINRPETKTPTDPKVNIGEENENSTEWTRKEKVEEEVPVETVEEVTENDEFTVFIESDSNRTPEQLAEAAQLMAEYSASEVTIDSLSDQDAEAMWEDIKRQKEDLTKEEENCG